MMENDAYCQRRAGLLMPVFSLPGNYGIGDFGASAYDFVRLLKNAGHSVWQMLPNGPTGFCNSPYKAFSAFAGNPYFISPDLLFRDGLLTRDDVASIHAAPGLIDYGTLFKTRFHMLRAAYARWARRGIDSMPQFTDFEERNAFWLDDYALYMGCKEHFDSCAWTDWPVDIRNRRPHALDAYRHDLADEVGFWKFVQYTYFQQWNDLKVFANSHGIRIVGDMPFYVQNDSADVWAHREIFRINPVHGNIEMFAGASSDAFANHTRNWGMPCYNWDAASSSGFAWHINRFRHNAILYDALRMDHAIGYIRYYGITDMDQQWFDTPAAVQNSLIPQMTQVAHMHNTQIIAEDLGTVPPHAYDLFARLKWDGIRVLQFALADKNNPYNIHLPELYSDNVLACPGTHDNMTLHQFLRVHNMPTDGAAMRSHIARIYASRAGTVVLSVPDVLGLDEDGRICFGCDFGRSWRWRLSNLDQITAGKQRWLKKMAVSYGRE